MRHRSAKCIPTLCVPIGSADESGEPTLGLQSPPGVLSLYKLQKSDGAFEAPRPHVHGS